MNPVVQKIVALLVLVACLLPAAARADTTDSLEACFNYLKAQDYARAEQEAKQLLQSPLARTDEWAVQLCLGKAYYEMGRRADALPAFQRVEALSQTTRELAVAYNWLGISYTDLNDLDRAELYDQRALKAVRELGDKSTEALTLNNLALVADTRGDTERALKLYREALALRPKAEQGATLNNIAAIHSSRKEYKQAIKLFRQAVEIDRTNGDAHATAKWQINLGEALRRNKQYPDAEKELLAGLNAVRLLGDKHWEASACETLGRLSITQDNPKRNVGEARQWMEKAEALYREIGDTQSADGIAKLLAGK